MDKLSSVDCSALCWALAKWGFRPAPVWLDLLYAQLRWENKGTHS